MPTDNQGKYQLNNQRMRRSNELAGSAGPAAVAEAPVEEVASAAPFATVFDNGDGTGYTEMADGNRVDHPDFEATKATLMADGDPAMTGQDQTSPAQDSGDWA